MRLSGALLALCIGKDELSEIGVRLGQVKRFLGMTLVIAAASLLLEEVLLWRVEIVWVGGHLGGLATSFRNRHIRRGCSRRRLYQRSLIVLHCRWSQRLCKTMLGLGHGHTSLTLNFLVRKRDRWGVVLSPNRLLLYLRQPTDKRRKVVSCLILAHAAHLSC